MAVTTPERPAPTDAQASTELGEKPELSSLECEEQLAAAMWYDATRSSVESATHNRKRAIQAAEKTTRGFEIEDLADAFRKDPTIISRARNYLADVVTDPRLTDEQKTAYLDGYFDLILRLDHRAFPATESTRTKNQLTDYLADGYVDKGTDDSFDSSHDKNAIIVEKRLVLEDYRHILPAMLQESQQYPAEDRSAYLARAIAEAVHEKMPDRRGIDASRAKALAIQVLMQAVGVVSKVAHTTQHTAEGTRADHYVNLVLDDQWYLIDSTHPTYHKSSGQLRTHPSIFPMTGSPHRDRYRFKQAGSHQVTYDLYDKSRFGFIAAPAEETTDLAAYPSYDPRHRLTATHVSDIEKRLALIPDHKPLIEQELPITEPVALPETEEVIDLTEQRARRRQRAGAKVARVLHVRQAKRRPAHPRGSQTISPQPAHMRARRVRLRPRRVA